MLTTWSLVVVVVDVVARGVLECSTARAATARTTTPTTAGIAALRAYQATVWRRVRSRLNPWLRGANSSNGSLSWSLLMSFPKFDCRAVTDMEKGRRPVHPISPWREGGVPRGELRDERDDGHG